MSKKLTTKQIAVCGMMGAISIVLGATGLGMFPIPNLTGRATIMHVPVILAAVLEGPAVGAFTGLIFGAYSFLTPTGAIPADPIVRILPRVLIGITAYYSYRLFRRKQTLGLAMAGIIGTLTNTIGYLGLAVLFKYINIGVAISAAPQATVELVIATVLTVVLGKALRRGLRIHEKEEK